MPATGIGSGKGLSCQLQEQVWGSQPVTGATCVNGVAASYWGKARGVGACGL